MSIKVRDDKMAREAERLLRGIFNTATHSLARLLEEKNTAGLEQLVERVSGDRYPDEIVSGVQTVLLVTARFTRASRTKSVDILSHAFSDARTIMDGTRPRLLRLLKEAKRELPAWLEVR